MNAEQMAAILDRIADATIRMDQLAQTKRDEVAKLRSLMGEFGGYATDADVLNIIGRMVRDQYFNRP